MGLWSTPTHPPDPPDSRMHLHTRPAGLYERGSRQGRHHRDQENGCRRRRDHQGVCACVRARECVSVCVGGWVGGWWVFRPHTHTLPPICPVDGGTSSQVEGGQGGRGRGSQCRGQRQGDRQHQGECPCVRACVRACVCLCVCVHLCLNLKSWAWVYDCSSYASHVD